MERVTMSHGGGGKDSTLLIRDIFYRCFNNDILLQGGDAGIIQGEGHTIAITTDSFVVNPFFFPGGDIGKLSVCGTVNDLAVSGATPLYITAAFILEEGFFLRDLRKIVMSMANTAKEAGVKIVAGDTKVVEKGKAEGVYINTTGVGYFQGNSYIPDKNSMKIGDKILINGDIGDHGMCIMGEREFMGISEGLESDCTPLNSIIKEVMSVTSRIRIMRDPTRGGVAATLYELMEDTHKGVLLYEDTLPFKASVKDFASLLGVDPLYSANEGKFICIVDKDDAEAVLTEMKKHPLGKNSAIIGEIVEDKEERVYMKTCLGGTRILKVAEGELLPRIC